jgi:hypothetical protein
MPMALKRNVVVAFALANSMRKAASEKNFVAFPSVID